MAITPKDFRDLREKSGFTLERLGEVLHVNKGTASRLERGKMGLDIGMASAWATACGAHLVLQREGEELQGLAEEERVLVETWRRVEPDPGRQAILLEVAGVLEGLQPQALAMLAASIEAAGKSCPSRAAEITDRERTFKKEKTG